MSKHLPLMVDLDGTLVLTDTLGEGFTDAVLRKPVSAFFASLRLFSGRPAFKKAILDISNVDYEALPVREELLSYLQAQKAAGRQIYLVTAANQDIAERVAARFEGVFDGAYGSNEKTNLKGSRKQEFLRKTFPGGYVYAGDSAADLKVWKDADAIIFAGAKSSTQRAAAKLGKPIEETFENNGRTGVRVWLKALRVHQWAKNLLLFAAIFLSGMFLSVDAWIATIIGFVLMGTTASGSYLLNDLLDLSADRRHRSKCKRPLASGDLFVVKGLFMAPTLIIGSLIAAAFLSVPFAIGLSVYLVTTLSYSFGLKRVAMVDVMILAMLFTLRIALGALVIHQPLSEWLLTFSMFFFFSLSIAKRHVEVAASETPDKIRGRGYYGSDAPMTLGWGLASASASIVIMVLFLAESAFKSNLYSMQEFLWAVPLLISLWLMRIWMLAHRGQLDDDPVSFAVKDKISIGLGAILGIAFLCAVFAGQLPAEFPWR